MKAIGVGGGIALTVLMGGFIGYKIGAQFGLKAAGLILGLFGALAGSLYNVFRMFSK